MKNSPVSRLILALLLVLGIWTSAVGTASQAEASPKPSAPQVVLPHRTPEAVQAPAQAGGTCAEAAKVAWANRWNPWPSRYVIMAIGMAAACGYWIGGLWSNKAQQAWNKCWPNCPWWYAFKFW